MDKPLPIITHCPKCAKHHVDEGEWATKPHRTHLCAGCGTTWRPAAIPTVGVPQLPRCAALSSISGARCVLEEGHPQDSPLRFHLFKSADPGTNVVENWETQDLQELRRLVNDAVDSVRLPLIKELAEIRHASNWNTRGTDRDHVEICFNEHPRSESCRYEQYVSMPDRKTVAWAVATMISRTVERLREHDKNKVDVGQSAFLLANDPAYQRELTIEVLRKLTGHGANCTNIDGSWNCGVGCKW